MAAHTQRQMALSSRSATQGIQSLRHAPLRAAVPSRGIACFASADKAEQPVEPFRPSPVTSRPAERKGLIDMSRRTLLHGGLATVGLATCPCCPSPANAEEWNYETGTGSTWAGVCAAGTRQSPVDLPLGAMSAPGTPSRYTCKFGDIEFKYGNQERVTVVNTGHGTMQVNFRPGNIATIGGVDLELLQFHFHTPSEHAFDGRRTPMEVHLVHKVLATGGLAVVGVMMEAGGVLPNPTVQTAYVFAPPNPKEQVAATRPIDPQALLPAPADGRAHRPYMHYAGSLTTPPCSEGVDWFVMTNLIKVTDRQILDFMKYIGGGVTYAQNARPVQPINERKFKYEL